MILTSDRDKESAEVSCTAIADQLGRMVSALQGLGATTETEFLRISQWLSDFHRRGSEVEKQASAMTEMIGGGAIGGVVDSFSGLLDDLRETVGDAMSQSSGSRDALQDFRERLWRLQAPLNGFSKIVKTLQALGFSTRVESAQVSVDEENLVVLADSLKGLATTINKKTDQVCSTLESLDELNLRAGDVLGEMESRDLEEVQRSFMQATDLVGDLAQQQMQGREHADELARHSRKMALSISEVVSSVQYHDITRQQIEHVCTALVNLRRELSQPGKDPDHDSVATTCRVQAAQLQNSREIFDRAVQQIVDGLGELVTSITAIAQQTSQLASSTDLQQGGIHREIEEILDRVRQALAEYVRTSEETTSAVDAVSGTVTEMTELLEQIERIGTEMKLVAFNAGIQAVHSRERGAALAVIADSIAQLSALVLNLTLEFARRFAEITMSAKALAESESVRRRSGERSEALQHETYALLLRLRQMGDEAVTMLRQIEETSFALGKEFSRAAAAITISRHWRQVIVPIEEELEEISHLLGGGNVVEDEASEEATLHSHYTMQSERDVHQAARGGSNVDEGEAAGKGDSEGFGDNVELF
ncbi:MAG: hypothetical protein C0621_04820 [Desulfuromonas sp.]|nr:MAG: hypothetical protein C0621_04820 [Desulfuromonas sp.]